MNILPLQFEDRIVSLFKKMRITGAASYHMFYDGEYEDGWIYIHSDTVGGVQWNGIEYPFHISRRNKITWNVDFEGHPMCEAIHIGKEFTWRRLEVWNRVHDERAVFGEIFDQDNFNTARLAYATIVYL